LLVFKSEQFLAVVVEALQESQINVALYEFNKRFWRYVPVIVDALVGLSLKQLSLFFNLLLEHKVALKILLRVASVILLFIT
jgi:hypothetical protein